MFVVKEKEIGKTHIFSLNRADHTAFVGEFVMQMVWSYAVHSAARRECLLRRGGASVLP
jgi:hypothetical protein